jgi:hypothetical protein
VVSAMDSHGRILGFLDNQNYEYLSPFSGKAEALMLHTRCSWVRVRAHRWILVIAAVDSPHFRLK